MISDKDLDDSSKEKIRMLVRSHGEFVKSIQNHCPDRHHKDKAIEKIYEALVMACAGVYENQNQKDIKKSFWGSR